jgi:hypothetical protein
MNLDAWLYNFARRRTTPELTVSGVGATKTALFDLASGTGTNTSILRLTSTSGGTNTNAILITGALTYGINFTTPTFAASGNYGCLINSPWIDIPGGSGFGAKLMFQNTAATVLYGLGLRCRTSVAGGIAVGLNVSASTHVAASGGVQAIQGYCQIDSTYTVAAGSTNASCALYGKTLSAATCAAILSSLWVDEGSTTKATTHYLANFTLNGGAITLDAIFHVYAGTQTASKLFSLEGSCGVSAGSTKSTPGGVDKWLDITIDGTAHYVPCYASKTA